MRVQKKHNLKLRRQWRVRTKVNGTAERPRMSTCFTNTHIYVQFIDDIKGATLAAVSTRDKGEKVGANAANAVKIGKRAAEAAIGKGIKAVVFDRGGNRYHGKVKALADAAREAGLKF